MAKKLTLSNINKEYTKFNEKSEVSLMDGKYTIEVNKHMKKTDIQKMLIDYDSMVEQLQKDNNIESLKGTIIIPTLLIKYLTNIDIPEEADKLLMMAEQLINLDLFSEIMASLPEDEIVKMTLVIDQVVTSTNKMVKEIENKVGKESQILL